MRIDEFKAAPTGAISIYDRIRLVSVGFDILSMLVVICIKEFDSKITSNPYMHSHLTNEALLDSPITKGMRLHGNLCW